MTLKLSDLLTILYLVENLHFI